MQGRARTTHLVLDFAARATPRRHRRLVARQLGVGEVLRDDGRASARLEGGMSEGEGEEEEKDEDARGPASWRRRS